MPASNDFFASSPTVAQPLASAVDYFPAAHYHEASAHTTASMTNGFGDSLAPPTGSLPLTPGAIAGRKRSRGDIYSQEDDESMREDTTSVPGTSLPAQNGTSFTHLSNPDYSAQLDSQSGTRVEERTQLNQFQLLPEQQEQQRPIVIPRKSQRIDFSAAADSNDLAQLVLPPQMREVTAEPLIDEATRTLGISWTRMDSTEPLRISQAAYQKWIQNHYPSLKEVAIWFENSAIPGYLVVAQNAYNNRAEYYIFSQDLTEARLVTSDAAQLIPRLQMLPALHLAAPGGCIKAESDPMLPERPKTGSKHYARISEDFSAHAGMFRGYFPSYEMDMD